MMASRDTAFRYAVALDAGRGDAYVGEYFIVERGRLAQTVGESLLPFDNLAALLESGVARWISTPDQAVFDALGSGCLIRESASSRNLRRPPGGAELPPLAGRTQRWREGFSRAIGGKLFAPIRCRDFFDNPLPPRSSRIRHRGYQRPDHRPHRNREKYPRHDLARAANLPLRRSGPSNNTTACFTRQQVATQDWL